MYCWILLAVPKLFFHAWWSQNVFFSRENNFDFYHWRYHVIVYSYIPQLNVCFSIKTGGNAFSACTSNIFFGSWDNFSFLGYISSSQTYPDSSKWNHMKKCQMTKNLRKNSSLVEWKFLHLEKLNFFTSYVSKNFSLRNKYTFQVFKTFSYIQRIKCTLTETHVTYQSESIEEKFGGEGILLPYTS